MKPATPAETTVLITGATRGLGLACAEAMAQRGYRLVLCGRDPQRLQACVDAFRARGAEVVGQRLDVASDADAEALAESIEGGRLHADVLINNAGIVHRHDEQMTRASLSAFQDTCAVNLFGPVRMMQLLVPGMRERGWGRVVNVSSGMGSITELKPNLSAYRTAKAALNVATRLAAMECLGSGVLINAVCPGWVRTDLGGADAPRSAQEAALGLVWAAELPDGGPTGGFFRDGAAVSF